MKLLFDQNLSHRLLDKLAEAYHGARHVRIEGLARASDEEVWQFARDEDLAIVSKDSDFHQRSLLYGHPPKVVWVRRGNCSTAEIEEILVRHRGEVERFLESEEASFLILP